MSKPDLKEVQTYTIEINEDQRQLIMQVLDGIRSDVLEQLQRQPGWAHDTAAEEYQALIQMFGTLDIDEANSPGIIHGFCY